MIASGLRTFRVDLLRETPEQVGALLDRYAAVINGAIRGLAPGGESFMLGQFRRLP
jgi:hypothetical protein